MKTVFLFLLLPIGLFAQVNTDAAVAYNDKIVTLQNTIGYKMLAMNEHIGLESSTMTSSDAARLEVLKATKEAIVEVQKMKSFDGSDEMRKSALALFQFYERVVTTEYKEAITILYKEDPTDADFVRLEVLVTKITDEETIVDTNFEKVQVAFAKKYNIDLEENELQEEIDAE